MEPIKYPFQYGLIDMDTCRNLADLNASPILVMLIRCQRRGFIEDSCTAEGKQNVIYLTRNVALNNLP